jgi:hypothetical protein
MCSALGFASKCFLAKRLESIASARKHAANLRGKSATRQRGGAGIGALVLPVQAIFTFCSDEAHPRSSPHKLETVSVRIRKGALVLPVQAAFISVAIASARRLRRYARPSPIYKRQAQTDPLLPPYPAVHEVASIL